MSTLRVQIFAVNMVLVIAGCGGTGSNVATPNGNTGGASNGPSTGGNGPSSSGGASQIANSSSISSGGNVGIGGAVGTSSTGGATTGASATGGKSSTGGAATGGKSSTGGAATGGAATGGTATGGAATGGKSSTGGAATGGAATGGAATGGAPTGGKSSTGGAATGGVATGGKSSTGGAATGGSSSSSNCAGPTLTSGTQQCSSNLVGTSGNYGWQIWSAGTGGCFTPHGVGAAFKATWNNSGDFLAREGCAWNATKTYDQYGDITADYAYTKTGTDGGFSFVGVYGWSNNPLIEYYIVDDWFGSATPPTANGTLVGTLAVDGGTYNIYKHQQVNQPSYLGTNDTFWQYFSIRQTQRQCGHIDVSAHFKKWASLSLNLGVLFEAKLLIEVGGGSGSIDYTSASMTCN